jgi:hypothetical protein
MYRGSGLGDIQNVATLAAVPVATRVLGRVRMDGVQTSSNGRQLLDRDHKAISVLQFATPFLDARLGAQSFTMHVASSRRYRRTGELTWSE